MRINRLTVRNFRGFEDKTVHFHPHFNVLIGDNGAGKTALLDALAIAAGSLFLGFDGVPAPSITSSEVRVIKFEQGGAAFIRKQYPVVVEWTCEMEKQGFQQSLLPAQCTRELTGDKRHTTWVKARDMKKAGAWMQAQIRQGKALNLPLIAYYGTGRLWLLKRFSEQDHEEVGERFDGYLDCLSPASNPKHLRDWMRRQTYAALQQNRRSGLLDAIENAVCGCVEDCSRFFYDVGAEELRIALDDGRLLPFDALSDGYRNMIAMAADMAWRAGVLNPHFGRQAPADTAGIVLIDELDLHLHPKWQRRIVFELKQVFPKIQFVATTHSPFIVQNLRPGELINLDPTAEPGIEYADRSPEDIAEEVMGVELPQRSHRRQAMWEAAEEYYRLLRRIRDESHPDVQKLKRQLDKLLEPFADDPAYQAFLKMERLAAEGERAGAVHETA